MLLNLNIQILLRHQLVNHPILKDLTSLELVHKILLVDFFNSFSFFSSLFSATLLEEMDQSLLYRPSHSYYCSLLPIVIVMHIIIHIINTTFQPCGFHHKANLFFFVPTPILSAMLSTTMILSRSLVVHIFPLIFYPASLPWQCFYLHRFHTFTWSHFSSPRAVL
eukprot:Sdes_comp20956_c0_seq1m18690